MLGIASKEVRMGLSDRAGKETIVEDGEPRKCKKVGGGGIRPIEGYILC